MKKLTIVLFLSICFLPFLYGQKVRFGQVPPKATSGVDYPIAVHIHEAHIRKNCGYDWQSGIIGGPKYTCPEVAYLDVVMDGKKIELMGQSFQKFSISPGDNHARIITKKASNTDAPSMGLKYVLLIPEGYIWRCVVTGLAD